MVVKNLEFFDKDGYNLNLNWNENRRIWEGNIFFPRVSVGLYENTTIYAIEYIGGDNVDDAYSYPVGEGNIVFSWDLANSFVDEFFMFDFDEDYELKDTSALIHTPYDGPLCETLIINRFDKYIVPLLNPSQDIEKDDLLEIHVAFKANEESAASTYKRTLIMSYENGYTKYEIARITFFAETIEEDERLKIWNENLGYNLKPEDTLIFKHSDIHECMPDYEILNEKRKELMLEGHNIYPFIGGYKAILNAIKFFGYDNLNIVEYWQNINEYDDGYGKLYRTYVYSLKNKKTISTKRKPISLDTKDFKKLNNISLSYNINHPERIDGKKYDEYGLPNVIEDFDKNKRDDFRLTIEEALVKLFALKKKLNDEFMPGSTIVSDVIGEGNYFGINLIGNNPQISTINHVESKGYVDFTVFPNKYCYITENEDFARYIAEMSEIRFDETIGNIGDKTIDEISKFYVDSDADSDAISEIDTRTLGGIINDLMEREMDVACDYYKNYYSLTADNKYGDANEYGLRELPEAKNVYKDIVDDIVGVDPYGENDVVPDMVACAKVVLQGVFDENLDWDITSIIEWKVTHPEKGWSVSYSGYIKRYKDVLVQLPYLGNYDVEISVWDKFNHCSKQYTKDAIIVKPYNIDIRGFYYDARPLPDNLKYDLFIPHEYIENPEDEQKYYLWSKKESDGVTKGIITLKRYPSEISLQYDVVGTYIIDGDVSDEYIGISNCRGVDGEHWVSIINKNASNDVLEISWVNDTSYGIDVYNFVEELKNVPFDNSYSPERHRDDLYHVIKKNVDRMLSYAIQEHLVGKSENETMRNYQPDGSVSFKGPYYKYDVDNILYKAERGYKEYEHLNREIVNLYPGDNYEYVRYINSVVDIKPLTWVILGFDHSRITGRIINEEYPKWTLTMLGDALDTDINFQKDKIVTTHNGLYFTYLFEDEGAYKIKLEMLDINGNKYEFEKNIVIVNKDANYEMYHSLNDEYNLFLEEKKERTQKYIKM